MFIAVELPPDVKAALTGTAWSMPDFLRPAVRWSQAQMMHLTLRFLGDTEPDLVEAIAACMREASERSALHAATGRYRGVSRVQPATRLLGRYRGRDRSAGNAPYADRRVTRGDRHRHRGPPVQPPPHRWASTKPGPAFPGGAGWSGVRPRQIAGPSAPIPGGLARPISKPVAARRPALRGAGTRFSRVSAVGAG